jgi:phosphoglycolate phosphatase
MMSKTELRHHCIVFDLDGTLLDTREGMIALINELLEELGRGSVTPAQLAESTHQGLAAMLGAALGATGALPTRQRRAQLEQELRRRYLGSASRRIMPYPGAAQLLDALRTRGAWLAICSNQEQATAEHLLDLFDLRRYFREVVGGDTFVERKPDPMGLRWLMLCARAEPECTLMVGDSALDAECALRAGATMALMSHGYGGELTQPHLRVEDFAQLHRYLLDAPLPDRARDL